MDHVRRTAQHATVLAKHHRGIAAAVTKCFGKTKKAAALTEIDPQSLAELLESFEEHHTAIGQECADYSEHCAEYADAEAEKAAQARLRKRTGDDAAMQPGTPVPTPPGCVAVAVAIPRTAKTIPATPEVDVQFEKLIAGE